MNQDEGLRKLRPSLQRMNAGSMCAYEHGH
jgi:hypothetical protein